MKKGFQSRAAIFFTVLFLAIVSSPIVITTIDDTIDITNVDGLGEEEETESLKLICELLVNPDETQQVFRFSLNAMKHEPGHYTKPFLLHFVPPPEQV